VDVIDDFDDYAQQDSAKRKLGNLAASMSKAELSKADHKALLGGDGLTPVRLADTVKLLKDICAGARAAKDTKRNINTKSKAALLAKCTELVYVIALHQDVRDVRQPKRKREAVAVVDEDDEAEVERRAKRMASAKTQVARALKLIHEDDRATLLAALQAPPPQQQDEQDEERMEQQGGAEDDEDIWLDAQPDGQARQQEHEPERAEPQDEQDEPEPQDEPERRGGQGGAARHHLPPAIRFPPGLLAADKEGEGMLWLASIYAEMIKAARIAAASGL
jgi:hypothetical protein